MSVDKSIYHYCNYQERSHKEVRNKLYELGCNTDEVNAHLSDLIEKGVLNEERYAKAIVRGKFNLKQWGRVKILQLLNRHVQQKQRELVIHLGKADTLVKKVVRTTAETITRFRKMPIELYSDDAGFEERVRELQAKYIV